jgi:hypothetical protein
MVDGDGDVFYPDSLEDARYFDRHYGARPLHPAKFNEWFGVEVPSVERCGPECSEQHTYTGACVLAPTGRTPGGSAVTGGPRGLTPQQLAAAVERAGARWPAARLELNSLGNLCVLADGEYVGWVDMRDGTVHDVTGGTAGGTAGDDEPAAGP